MAKIRRLGLQMVMSFRRARKKTLGWTLAAFWIMGFLISPTFATVTVFDPSDADHLAEDASHFGEADVNNLSTWREWWYANFHDPNAGTNGWHGLIVFNTKGDLSTNSEPASHSVSAIVSIWDYNGSSVYVQEIPLYLGDISGYSSSGSQADVGIKVSTTKTSTFKYNKDNDTYTIDIENATGTVDIDLTYTRITKGFLTDLEGFPESDSKSLFWVVPMPYADVTGTIKVPGVSTQDINGTGYHDHNWGHWGEKDAIWDWVEIPLPDKKATIVLGKVFGFGRTGLVVAMDTVKVVAFAENETMEVTYRSWAGITPNLYPTVDHIIARQGLWLFDIQTNINQLLNVSYSGYIAEIIAGYSGKIYKTTDHSDVIYSLSSDTNIGFLEYKNIEAEDDVTLPGAPTNVSATANGCIAIDVSWNAPGDSDVKGYNIYRSSTSGGPYLYVGSVNGTSYTSFFLKEGTTYYYVVTSQDSVPNESDYSLEASAITNTGCPEICDWPRRDQFWDGPHMNFPFGLQPGDPTGGTITVGNLTDHPTSVGVVNLYLTDPTTSQKAPASNLVLLGTEFIESIPPFSEKEVGPFLFSPPASGNGFGQPYWTLVATVETSNDPIVSGFPHEDNNVAVRSYWETVGKKGVPEELKFRTHNLTQEPSMMLLELDTREVPRDWGVALDPPPGKMFGMSPGEELVGTLVVTPGGAGTAKVHIQQLQFDSKGEFVRITGGLTFQVTAEDATEAEDDDDGDKYDDDDSKEALSILHLNRPNPFTRETEIEFRIMEERNHLKSNQTLHPVTLGIYNTSGVRVRILVNEEKAVGSYRVHWDGRDEKGKKVPSGIYFSRLQVREFVETKKMILLR